MNNKEYERLRWRCRRGMLEIDLFLVPFFENNYDVLSDAEKQVFQQLLAEQDPDLHALLMAKKKPVTDAEEQLIEKIRQYRFTVSRDQFL